MRARKTAALARLQDQRLTHLRAHLETRASLKADQIARCQQLRRYADPSLAPGHHHHG
jgi:hypothetical protein